jgi:hypothetical protein
MLIDKLRRLFEFNSRHIQHQAIIGQSSSLIGSSQPTPQRLPPTPSSPMPLSRSVNQAKPVSSMTDPQDDAHTYMAKVQSKINKLAEEFASGMINREQFQELYDHYQKELRTIEAWMDHAPESNAWRDARTEGKSVVIRRQHMARILGYAIYKNDSGMPIATIGKFQVGAALVIPMLSSYRSATREIFGAGMRSSQIENGRWLCFVPGEITTLIALFSIEPAAKQLKSLDQVHRLFEKANRHLLKNKIVDPSSLVLPHQSFVGHRR